MTLSWKLILDEICTLLDTYKGRDKILRTLCYSSKLIGGLHNNEVLAKKFLLFSKHMSATRTTLRLFDDLPMLKYNLEYGLGQEENDKCMALIGVSTNIIDQIYYPIEKIGWLAEHNFINNVNISKCDTASSICWVLSIYLTLTKSLRYLWLLQNHEKCIDLKYNDNKFHLTQKLIAKKNYQLLTCIRLSMDLIHAINTLPKGFLWAEKLNNWQIGLIATLSSVLGIYQIYAKRALDRIK